MDPAFNTQLIIAEANRFPSFKNATDLHTAVDVFGNRGQRPADKPGQVAKRFMYCAGSDRLNAASLEDAVSVFVRFISTASRRIRRPRLPAV